MKWFGFGKVSGEVEPERDLDATIYYLSIGKHFRIYIFFCLKE